MLRTPGRIGETRSSPYYYTIYPRRQRKTPPTSPNLTIGYIAAIISGLFFVWLLIVSILLGVLYKKSRHSINDLQNRFSIVNNTNNQYVSCCSEGFATRNCTCLLPGSQVSCWNAQENVPFLESGVPPVTDGILYVVCQSSVDEQVTLDGNSQFEIGDYVLYVPDSGEWFVNKARGGSQPFLFQNFIEILECDGRVEPNQIMFTAVTLDESSHWIIFESSPNSISFGFSLGSECFFQSGSLPAELANPFGGNNIWLTIVEEMEEPFVFIFDEPISFRIDETLDVFSGPWSNDLWSDVNAGFFAIRFRPSDMFYTTTI
jgi:hypothetical protein